jgi:glycine/D-amino acid oxidase-like deaminating enzyme/nitrite reductase/ring-hydroxylating ferredoxin subunit
MESARKRSAWLRTTSPQSFAPLRGVRQTDVVVIGGGITGLTAALLLKERGKQVTLLEAWRIAEGATGHTSAHLTTELERGYVELSRSFGTAALRRVVSARHAAIAQIAQWVDQHRIDCGFRRVPGYSYAADHAQRRELLRELHDLREVDNEALWVDDVPFVTARGGVRFSNQAELQPVDYLRALAVLVHGQGSVVCEGSPVVEYKDGNPCVVKTATGEVHAEAVVLATHTPVGRTVLHSELIPYRSYVLAARLEGDTQPSGLFWDNDDPYHYVRGYTQPDGARLLIVGGADHKTGQTKDERQHYATLERWTREHFAVSTIDSSWSTELFESVDGLPYVGHLGGERHTFLATGFAGDGLTFGTLAAQAIADELTARANAMMEILSPKRLKPFAAGRRFVRENANVALHFVKDRLRAGDQASVRDLLPGQGGLVTLGGRKVAAFRDDQGKLHTLSAVCQHLKCIVQWNTAERTWDCPCHGGRYAPTGEVLSGPPMHPLSPVDLDDEPK